MRFNLPSYKFKKPTLKLTPFLVSIRELNRIELLFVMTIYLKAVLYQHGQIFFSNALA